MKYNYRNKEEETAVASNMKDNHSIHIYRILATLEMFINSKYKPNKNMK